MVEFCWSSYGELEEIVLGGIVSEIRSRRRTPGRTGMAAGGEDVWLWVGWGRAVGDG